MLEILKRREVPGIATVYLARPSAEPREPIEFVDAVDKGVPREEKWVLMLSTQSGCVVGCRICDAGNFPFSGNLPLETMLDQVRAALALRPEADPSRVRMLKIHFARIGEPSFNPAVIDCIEHLAAEGSIPGLVPSISTVAPDCKVCADFLDRLAGVKDRLFPVGRFQLQFSIMSTDPEARAALIPIRKWGLDRIADFGGRWFRPGDRKITLNFALASEIPFDAAVIEKCFSPERFLVKVTPVNPTRRADRNRLTTVWYEPPGRVVSIREDLERRGFSVILNASWPEEVEGRASCGQLAEESLLDASLVG
jgi:23S rRNA (adenine2503-C2)-methyltransferase